MGNIPEEDFEGGNSYNSMNWNGQIWEKVRLLIKTYDGRVIEYPLVTIFQVDESKKWAFSSLGGYSEFSMGRWSPKYLSQVSGRIVGGISNIENKAFVSGTSGSLTKWENEEFELLPTGLDSDITGLAFANDTLKFGTEFTLRQYVDGQVIPEFPPDAPRAFRLEGRYYDIWHSGAAWWYATSRGLYRFSPDSGYVQIGDRSVSFITGNGDNDVIAVDAVGGVYHWNGQRLSKLHTPFGNSYSPQVQGVAMKGDLVMMVG